MAKPKKRKPIEALKPPLFGIYLPAAACNAAEARHRGGGWLTWGMVLTSCDKPIGHVAVWRSRVGARKEIESFNLRYPAAACVDGAGREYGHEIRIYCRLGDTAGRRGRPARSDIGRLIEGPDPLVAMAARGETFGVEAAKPMSFIERLCAERDAKAAALAEEADL
jgi:hypothetical protein